MPTANTRLNLLCIVTTFSITGCYSMNGYIMNASGLGYYEKGNYALAAQEFQTALANNPSNPDYMANLAKARMKMGDAAGAEQLFRQAITSSPAHQPSYHGYSQLLVEQGRGQEALRMLNSWAATQPYIAESHVELAWVQRELGQPDAAAQSLQSALQVNPNHSTALAHLGQYYHDKGQPDQAISFYQRSLESDWNQPEVQSRLASAASTAGPTHPMNQIAMGRGVHPHSLPPQELASSQQLAGPRLNQQWSQMAQYQPQPVPPMNVAGTLPAGQYSPGDMHVANSGYPTGGPGFGSPQVTAAPIAMNYSASMPHQQMTSPTPAPSATATFNAPTPTPDPAFVAPIGSNIPITSVSQSRAIDTSSADGLPEIEAF